MKAIFLVPVKNGIPDLPPFQNDAGAQLYYTEKGVLKGGYSVIGEANATDVEWLMLVETSQATIEAMKLSKKQILISTVREPVAPNVLEIADIAIKVDKDWVPVSVAPQLIQPDKDTKPALKAVGLPAAEVDKADLSTPEKAVESILQLCKVDKASYEAAGGVKTEKSGAGLLGGTS